MAEPTKKNPEIRSFQSTLMGGDITKAIHQDVCISCHGPATEFKDDISRKEFRISGMCQACQDSVFEDDRDLIPGSIEDVLNRW